MSDITIDTLKRKYAKPLENIQRLAFPTLEDSALLKEDHFYKHLELFPEGNFVALDGEKVVGLGSGFLINFDFQDTQHTFEEVIAGGYYTNHNPSGEWYYGGDISVHPNYRRRGIGTLLYQARKGIVKTLQRKGIVAGAVLPGYARHKKHMSAEEYVKRVVAGHLYDSTLSFQLRHGFKVRGLLENYIADPASDNWSALIVWENPEYKLEESRV